MIFIKINNSDDKKNKLLFELNSHRIQDKKTSVIKSSPKIKVSENKMSTSVVVKIPQDAAAAFDTLVDEYEQSTKDYSRDFKVDANDIDLDAKRALVNYSLANSFIKHISIDGISIRWSYIIISIKRGK